MKGQRLWMDQDYVLYLQWAMLIVDGAGIFSAHNRMMYYYTGRKNKGVFPIFVFFVVMFCVFLALSFSDLCVITNAPIWWAKLPIIRGHAFRLPLTVAMLWMIHYQYIGNGEQE